MTELSVTDGCQWRDGDEASCASGPAVRWSIQLTFQNNYAKENGLSSGGTEAISSWESPWVAGDPTALRRLADICSVLNLASVASRFDWGDPVEFPQFWVHIGRMTDE
jgi:hypothetical protein